MIILPAYNKSEIARLYFEKLGETLTKQEAVNRWRMIRKPDLKLLSKVFAEVYKQQLKELKKLNKH